MISHRDTALIAHTWSAWSGTVALVLATLLTASTGSAGVAAAIPNVTVERLGGATRYETMAEISQSTWPGAGDLVVARGDLFPDAIAASFLAGAYNGGGPILLTPTEQLHPATRSEIERLTPSRVWIMGDETAVSANVEAEIRAIIGPQGEIQRQAGADRYETAAAASGCGLDTFDIAIVATGQDFADALSAGPLAFWYRMKLFLTTPDRLHPAAARGLRCPGSRHVLVVGGPAAVSEQVLEDIRAICYQPGECLDARRIAGRDRTETAALLADEMVRISGQPPRHVNLARGDAFPDAAAGGAHGGPEVAPILLTTNPTTLGDATRAWLERHSDSIESIHAFGTEDAISNEVLEDARQAASSP